jgi:citrate lyase subunit beta/citryl-CoA lyase
MSLRPRRSALYMPGTNARAIEKARTLPVDAVILDLEDSVAPEAKTDAREQVRAAIKAGGFGSRELVVRINGLDTEWWLADVDMIHDVRPDAVLLPKVSQPVTLENLADRLMDLGTDHRIKVWAMIETPFAVLNVREIAAVARDIETRLSCFVVGTSRHQ